MDLYGIDRFNVVDIEQNVLLQELTVGDLKYYKIANVKVEVLNFFGEPKINLYIPQSYVLNNSLNKYALIHINGRIFVCGYKEGKPVEDYYIVGVLDDSFCSILPRHINNEIDSKIDDICGMLRRGGLDYEIDLHKKVLLFRATNKQKKTLEYPFLITKIVANSNTVGEQNGKFIDIINKLIHNQYITLAGVINNLKPQYEDICDAVMSNHARLYDGEKLNYLKKYIDKVRKIRLMNSERKSVREQLLEYAYDRLAKAEYDYFVCNNIQNVKLCYGILNGYGIAIEALLRVLLIREITDEEIQKSNMNTKSILQNVDDLYKSVGNVKIKDKKNPIIFLKMIRNVYDGGFKFGNTRATLGNFLCYNSKEKWDEAEGFDKNTESYTSKFNYADNVKQIFCDRFNDELYSSLKIITDFRNNDSHPNPEYLDSIKEIRRLIFGRHIDSEEQILSQGQSAYSTDITSKGLLWNVLKDNWDGLIEALKKEQL